jgi:hypothetical protein
MWAEGTLLCLTNCDGTDMDPFRKILNPDDRHGESPKYVKFLK